jgi:hypothetical protein
MTLAPQEVESKKAIEGIKTYQQVEEGPISFIIWLLLNLSIAAAIWAEISVNDPRKIYVLCFGILVLFIVQYLGWRKKRMYRSDLAALNRSKSPQA